MTRSVNGRSCPGPAPGARSRSRPRRSSSLDSPAAVHAPARSAMSLPSRRGCRPVKIRLLKAVRAHLDVTSRSFRAAAHVPGTDTPQITRYAPDALSRTKSLPFQHDTEPSRQPLMSLAKARTPAGLGWKLAELTVGRPLGPLARPASPTIHGWAEQIAWPSKAAVG